MIWGSGYEMEGGADSGVASPMLAVTTNVVALLEARTTQKDGRKSGETMVHERD